jgi:hypothetical protein
MLDQLIDETIVTLQPDALVSRQGTAALRRLMAHYAGKHPVSYWALLVSSERWRYQRHDIITVVAEQDWISETDVITALQFAELAVMSVEAISAHWEPEQCRISAVRIDGKPVVSLVCSAESVGREQRD